jgi:hypothetical protein
VNFLLEVLVLLNVIVPENFYWKFFVFLLMINVLNKNHVFEILLYIFHMNKVDAIVYHYIFFEFDYQMLLYHLFDNIFRLICLKNYRLLHLMNLLLILNINSFSFRSDYDFSYSSKVGRHGPIEPESNCRH